MKILGEEVDKKQLAILAAAFGIGLLAALALQKRSELSETVRKIVERN